MNNMNDEYTLLGKEQRTCLKTITEKRCGKDFTYSEKLEETICYFTYCSDDIKGKGTIMLYVENNIIPYDKLIIGKVYKLSFSNSYINFIMNLNEYNKNLFEELEKRENFSNK